MTNLEKLTKIIQETVPIEPYKKVLALCVKCMEVTEKNEPRPITLFDLRKLLKDEDFLKLSKIWSSKLEDLKDVDIEWLLSVVQ